jgi:hypothetical protein
MCFHGGAKEKYSCSCIPHREDTEGGGKAPCILDPNITQGLVATYSVTSLPFRKGVFHITTLSSNSEHSTDRIMLTGKN